jgi:hypothetical protein
MEGVMGRKYSVEEIDQMRRSIDTMMSSHRSYDPVEQAKKIEERLRTYMLNGTEPDELKRNASEHFDRLYASQQWAAKNGLSPA